MTKYSTRHYSLLKLFAIICIVFNHSIRYGWPPFKILTNDFQLPLLFFASGFVFSYCIYDAGKYLSIGELVYKKFKRLFYPYILILLLWYLPIFYITGDARYQGKSILSIVFLEYPFGTNSDSLWFLMALFIIYIISYILKETLNYLNINNYKNIVICMFFILSGAKIVSSYFPQQFFLDRVALYSIHFFAGYILNIKKECVASFIEKHMVIPIFIIATLIIYYIDARYGFLACDETPSYPWTGIVVLQSLEIIKQFLLIGIWVCIARKIVNKYPVFVENKIVKYFEKRSFDIFLYHWPVLLALLQYLPIESPIAKAMTTAFVCMGISLLVAEMVDFLKRVRARCSGLGA